jgi:hypothetical protein
VTFEAIEAQGAEALLEQLRDELTGRTYKPLPARSFDASVTDADRQPNSPTPFPNGTPGLTHRFLGP